MKNEATAAPKFEAVSTPYRRTSEWYIWNHETNEFRWIGLGRAACYESRRLARWLNGGTL